MDDNSASRRYAELLKDLPPSPPTERAKSGVPTVRINGVLAASNVDPVAEGEKFARAVDVEKNPNLLVYGFGLGYHIEALLKLLPPNGKVAVIEANRELLSAASHGRDLSNVLDDARFTLVTGAGDADICQKLSSILSDTQWQVVIHPASFRLLPESFSELKRTFEMLRTDRRFGGSFGDQEHENIMANLSAIASSPGASALFGALRGAPAVLVGAGPSLDRNLAFLDRLKGRAFVLAVDTSAEVLNANGIACDMVVSVDPQPDSASHLFDSSAPLLFMPSTHPSVVARFAGRRLIILKEGHAFSQKTRELLADRGSTNAGGSVSCVALDFLARAGADPIGLVGQDFAFNKGLPYNRRTMAGFVSEPFGGAEGEDAAGNFTARADLLRIPTARGASGVTHANLFGYLRSAEEIIARHPATAFYNVNSEGAAIRGCTDIFSQGEAERIFGVGNVPELSLPEERPAPELEAELKKLLLEKE
ncbi:MAG: motility associated factor glycosyltransferase family protein [Nitrospinae bacterium]|nr:motility associated factor glycosyltransferase family protein [Nitrospinota bacterium]